MKIIKQVLRSPWFCYYVADNGKKYHNGISLKRYNKDTKKYENHYLTKEEGEAKGYYGFSWFSPKDQEIRESVCKFMTLPKKILITTIIRGNAKDYLYTFYPLDENKNKDRKDIANPAKEKNVKEMKVNETSLNEDEVPFARAF